jgi:hypothetical protein
VQKISPANLGYFCNYPQKTGQKKLAQSGHPGPNRFLAVRQQCVRAQRQALKMMMMMSSLWKRSYVPWGCFRKKTKKKNKAHHLP